LLPQLIDVLHALTEGQEFLSRKVRDARLDYTSHSARIVGTCRPVEPSDFAASGSFVGASPFGSIEIRRELSTDKVDLGAGPTSVNGFGNGSLPDRSIEVSAVPRNTTIPEAAPPCNPPAAIVADAGTPADHSSEPSARSDWLNLARPGETSTAPLNRDYNFFDELDSRLADLQDPAARSEDR
jgi:hypothetical protein